MSRDTGHTMHEEINLIHRRKRCVIRCSTTEIYILYQNDMIAELWQRLLIIVDVASEGKSINSRKILKSRDTNRETKVNIRDVCDGITVDTIETNLESKYKNVISLHFG